MDWHSAQSLQQRCRLMGVRYDDGSNRLSKRSDAAGAPSGRPSGPCVPAALVSRTQILLATKAAVAAGIAWAVALLADPHSRPYFAPLAVILIVQPTVYDSLSRAFQRVAGVVLGVAAALAVSHFLTPSGWSIAIIVFAGLLLGWSLRLGPQGVVQVPVSALLVFAVGSATPDYGGRRVVETLIGSAIAVLAVLVSPSAPDAGARDLRCPGTAASLSRPPHGDRVGHQLGMDPRTGPGLAKGGTRTSRGHRQGQAGPRGASAHCPLERTGPPATPGARASGRGAASRRQNCHPDAVDRPSPGGRGASCPPDACRRRHAGFPASAVEAYAVWVASPGEPADRQRLSDAIRVAGETFGQAVARAQRRWRDDPTQWLTFGTILAMSQRFLAEVGSPLEYAGRSGLRFARQIPGRCCTAFAAASCAGRALERTD